MRPHHDHAGPGARGVSPLRPAARAVERRAGIAADLVAQPPAAPRPRPPGRSAARDGARIRTDIAPRAPQRETAADRSARCELAHRRVAAASPRFAASRRSPRQAARTRSRAATNGVAARPDQHERGSRCWVRSMTSGCRRRLGRPLLITLHSRNGFLLSTARYGSAAGS